MPASGLLGTRRLCLILFTASSCRTTPASIFCSSSRSFASQTIAESEVKASFTVSYLRNSCGLSLESANYVSKHVNFESSERPDSVINLLKEQGFTDAHVSKFIKCQPFLLKVRPKEFILLKLEFFRSSGCSNAGIVMLFSRNPNLLMTSLERCIIPLYDIIKSVLLVDSKDIKSFQSVLLFRGIDPEFLALNIQQMRDRGVLNHSITFILMHYLAILFLMPLKFGEILNEVEQMGFDPSKCNFVNAVQVLSTRSKLTRESKLDVLERSGLSRDEAWALFRKQPLILKVSKEKITKVMDFLLNQMRWKSQDIFNFPLVLLFSLEKRTIPRCSVAHVLLSKGLEKEIKPSTLLLPSDEKFVKKYVISYQRSMPQLLDLYKGKVSLADV